MTPLPYLALSSHIVNRGYDLILPPVHKPSAKYAVIIVLEYTSANIFLTFASGVERFTGRVEDRGVHLVDLLFE